MALGREGRSELGVTHGLAIYNDADEGEAEQVYVFTVDKPVRRMSGQEKRGQPLEGSSWPIELTFANGYSYLATVRITRRQATDLIGLLAQAIARVED